MKGIGDTSSVARFTVVKVVPKMKAAPTRARMASRAGVGRRRIGRGRATHAGRAVWPDRPSSSSSRWPRRRRAAVPRHTSGFGRRRPSARRTGTRPASASIRSMISARIISNEARIGADGRGAGDRQAESGRPFGGLGVQVVDDLHVVADEADRHEHHAGGAFPGEPFEMVADIGLEPRLPGRAAAALEHELPAARDRSVRSLVR